MKPESSQPSSLSWVTKGTPLVKNPDHPLWNLLRMVVVMVSVVTSLGLLLAYGYQNKWSPADYVTIVGTLVAAATALGVFDYAKKKITLPRSNREGDDE